MGTGFEKWFKLAIAAIFAVLVGAFVVSLYLPSDSEIQDGWDQQ